jgi:hypothetical protein
MALIDVRCPADHLSEVYRPAADWPATPPCPTCGQPTVQVHLPPRAAWRPDPVVVFQAPDGSYRFPGRLDGPMTAHYRQHGFKEIAITSAAEMRRFEAQVNQHEYATAARRTEALQQLRELREQHGRAELRTRMRSMSRFGRAVAQAAIEQGNARPRERTRDPGFHNRAYSYDRSNVKD